jgi:hypothetical protein
VYFECLNDEVSDSRVSKHIRVASGNCVTLFFIFAGLAADNATGDREEGDSREDEVEEHFRVLIDVRKSLS